VCLLVAATLLILNTSRMAMFARRREVEVMKLVGATNWFIRVPFMLEGLIQGLVGSIPAVGAVWGLHFWLDHHQTAATATASPNIFESMIVSGSQTWLITISLLIIGAAVGVVGSAVAVSRFLDV
jgi:cell division transport system permease protein